MSDPIPTPTSPKQDHSKTPGQVLFEQLNANQQWEGLRQFDKDPYEAAATSVLTEFGPTLAINTSARLFDLVRYMRAELHDAELINDHEYAWLLSNKSFSGGQSGSPSRYRLESYDEMQATIKDLKDQVSRLKSSIASPPRNKPTLIVDP